jgi:hypothetical protein
MRWSCRASSGTWCLLSWATSNGPLIVVDIWKRFPILGLIKTPKPSMQIWTCQS